MAVPTKDEMTGVLRHTIEKAAEELGEDQVTRITEEMRALCVELTDYDSCYYVSFGTDGQTEFTIQSPGLEPMVTITTTSETLHNMCTGELNPAKAFALRKVKVSGVPLMKLRVAGDLLGSLFSCYDRIVSA